MSSLEVILSEKLISSWSEDGKNKLLALIKTHWKSFIAVNSSNRSDHSVASISASKFRNILYFLLQQVPADKLSKDTIVSFLQEFFNSKEFGKDGNLFRSTLADILCVLDAECSCVKESKLYKARFCQMVKDMREKKIISDSMLKERMDIETLELIGSINSAKIFSQKYVRIKTKLFYKQQKFNLYREENEGYAKLIVELDFSSRMQQDSHTVLTHIQALIGQFSLDPNRVLDIILEVCEFYPEKTDFFVDLIRAYPTQPSNLSQLLGFKLSSLKQLNEIPHEFYDMLALLMKGGVLNLDDMYPHMLPKDSEILECQQKIISEARRDSRVTVTVLLEAIPERRELSDLMTPDKSIVTPDYMETNQKICLLQALLKVAHWDLTVTLFHKMPQYYAVLFPIVRDHLAEIIEYSLEPLYRKIAPRITEGGKEFTIYPAVTRYFSFSELLTNNTLFDMCSEIGPYISLYPLLLIKLARTGRAFLKEYYSHSYRDQNEMEPLFCNFISLIDEALFPSLSLSVANCGLVEEVWNMIKIYPYEIRYLLYGSWKNISYSSTPILMRAKAIIIENLRQSLKRLTKDNAKQIGRQIGKMAHSNPGIVFDQILSQIQKYDNLIVPVVDAMKFLTYLGFDLLSYCIIEALSNPQKDRLKQEDLNISTWLQCLSQFAGTLFRKYSLELTGLIQYVANQLKSGKSFDLLVLKEVVQKMSGIDILEDINEGQVAAMMGGELLRSEAGSFSQIKNIKRSSNRLRETLVEEDLGLPVCILMAQHRNYIIFKEDNECHCKLLSHLYDQCQDTLVQFIDFMAAHLSPEEYTYHIPKLNQLASEYNIEADAAFYLLRPAINYSIKTNLMNLQKDLEQSSEKTKISPEAAKTMYIQAVEESASTILSETKLLYPEKIWEDITVQLFVTFWSLSAYDLIIPSEKYETEIARIKESKNEIDTNAELNQHKKKKEHERVQAMIDRLQDEQKQQNENHKCVLARIDHEKASYFNTNVTRNRSITQFLQLCIFPRCCYSITDALYCAQFALFLHQQRTPHFSTLLFYDRVFSDISYTVTCCTENETRRYGRFLQAVLISISKWHESKSVYDKECSNTPGFISMIRTSNDANENIKNCLDFENFRHICFKWHFKITKSLVICLESKEYLQIRNALIVLNKLLPEYPKVQHLSGALEKRVDKIKDEEKGKREDLYMLASAYIGQLRNHRNNLVSENDYHKKDDTKLPNPEPKKSDPPITSKGDDKPKNVSNSSSHSSQNSQNNKFVAKSPDTTQQKQKTSSTIPNHASIGTADNNHIKVSNSKSVQEPRNSHSPRINELRSTNQGTNDTRLSRDSRNSADSRSSHDSKNSNDAKNINDTKNSRDSRSNSETKANFDSANGQKVNSSSTIRSSGTHGNVLRTTNIGDKHSQEHRSGELRNHHDYRSSQESKTMHEARNSEHKRTPDKSNSDTRILHDSKHSSSETKSKSSLHEQRNQSDHKSPPTNLSIHDKQSLQHVHSLASEDERQAKRMKTELQSSDRDRKERKDDVDKDRKGERKRERNDNYSEMPKDPKRKRDLLDFGTVIVTQTSSSHNATHSAKPSYISTTNASEFGFSMTSPTTTTFPANSSPLTPTSSNSSSSLNNLQKRPQLNVEKISKVTIKKQPSVNHSTNSDVQSYREVIVKQHPQAPTSNKFKPKHEEMMTDRPKKTSIEPSTQQLGIYSVNSPPKVTNYIPPKNK